MRLESRRMLVDENVDASGEVKQHRKKSCTEEPGSASSDRIKVSATALATIIAAGTAAYGYYMWAGLLGVSALAVLFAIFIPQTFPVPDEVDALLTGTSAKPPEKKTKSALNKCSEGEAEGESDAEGKSDAEGEAEGETGAVGDNASCWEMMLEERVKERQQQKNQQRNMALLCSLPSDKMHLQKKLRYVQLRGIVSGTHFALPGIGAPPDFKVPVRAFRAEDLVGKYLVAVGWNEVGEYNYKRKEPGGEVERSQAPVSCFIPTKPKPGQEAAIYSYGCLLEVADAESWVGVKFAYHEEKLPAIVRPCADVQEVATPRTPSSCGSFASC